MILDHITRGMDDFDDNEAVAASAILGNSISCGLSSDNVASVVEVMLDGFEGAVPNWSADHEARSRQWRRHPTRKELRAQLNLVEIIGALAHFDNAGVAALRKLMTSHEYIGAAR